MVPAQAGSGLCLCKGLGDKGKWRGMLKLVTPLGGVVMGPEPVGMKSCSFHLLHASVCVCVYG